MKRFVITAGTCLALTFAGANVAMADDCTGHSHDTGTILGGVGGATIGGLASHSVAGAVVGGVVGGVAGNAIDRNQDCANQQAREERHEDQRDAYNQGYADRSAEETAPPPVEAIPAPRADDDVTVYREPGDR